MPFHGSLTTSRILESFTEEVNLRQGKVTDIFNDRKRLFARAVLSQAAEIQPGDQMRGGVAIKATDDGIWLYPYTFRLVCSNGAILAKTLDERPIADPHLRGTDAVLQDMREAVEACCKEEVFRTSIRTMQNMRENRGTNLLLQLASFLSPLAERHRDLLLAVMDQLLKGGDHSPFGVANAITATARDVQDPELKWDLEKLGGRIALGTFHRSADECKVETAELVGAGFDRTA